MDSEIDFLIVTPDARYAITGSRISIIIRIWDIANGKNIASFYGESPIENLYYSYPLSRIVAIENSRRIHILQLENVDSGPTIVTPCHSPSNGLIGVCCPRCSIQFAHHPTNRNVIIVCPGCSEQLKLNEFFIEKEWQSKK
jgi:WD40 repeat protein